MATFALRLLPLVGGLVHQPAVRVPRHRRLVARALPEVELWLDLRSTFCQEPETALDTLYRGVQKEMDGEFSGRGVSGLVVWRDPSAEPLDVGLPVVAVDPEDDADLAGLFVTAPASTVGAQTVALQPERHADAIAALDPAALVLLDGGLDGDSFPLVQLAASAASGRARLLVALVSPPQLAQCSEALVLGALASAPTLDGTDRRPRDETAVFGGEDGLGVALPLDARLWAHALMYRS